MGENMRRLVPLLVLAAATMGCALSRPPLTAIKANGVDRIPTKLGFYPILSSPAPVYMRVPHGMPPYYPNARTMAAEGAPEGATQPNVELKQMDDKVVIVPPTRSALSITEESQIMTGLISTRLATFGFSLKELPVEYLLEGGDQESSEAGTRFAISMKLMNQLREQYGIGAIIVGTAFFFIEEVPQRSYPEKNVVSAHLKIIDTETLDILGQVIMPYNSNGADLNDVSDDLAKSIARMAGIPVE